MEHTNRPAKPLSRYSLLRAVGGVTRVLLYGLVVCLVVSGIALRSARAQMGESSIAFGRELAQFGDLLKQPHRVRLNGESVFVASTTTDQPLASILNRFETACEQRSGGLYEQVGQLPEEVRKSFAPGQGAGASLGILRQESETEGAVACLAREGRGGYVELGERLREFARTTDLAALGKLRYVYVSRTPSGKTHVVVAWTEGSLIIKNIVGDGSSETPGSDSPGAPRPSRSRRVLSAEVDGTPSAVRVYVSEQSPQDVLQEVATEMTKRGWTPVPQQDGTKQAAVFSGPESNIIVATATRDAHTYVSMIESVAGPSRLQ